MRAWPGGVNRTAFVGENGTLVVDAEGHSHFHHPDGKEEDALHVEGMPRLEPCNHWHTWVDKALGEKIELSAPFELATRITEATDSLVRRSYRRAFAPPQFDRGTDPPHPPHGRPIPVPPDPGRGVMAQPGVKPREHETNQNQRKNGAKQLSFLLSAFHPAKPVSALSA